jgi:hypothetical protein
MHTQVLDDSTALLVDAEAAAYAEGLARLAGDEALRRRLGDSAKQRVRHHYSPSSFYRRVREIYGGSHPRTPDDHNGQISGPWSHEERRLEGGSMSCDA